MWSMGVFFCCAGVARAAGSIARRSVSCAGALAARLATAPDHAPPT